MANSNFTYLPRFLASADIDYAVDPFKLMLLSAVPSEANLDAWQDRADVTGEIAAGGGYSAGGFAVTATLNALDTAGNKQTVTFAAATPAIAAFTGSFVAGIIYKSTGVAGTDLVAHMLDFGGTITGSGGPLQITFTDNFEVQR